MCPPHARATPHLPHTEVNSPSGPSASVDQRITWPSDVATSSVPPPAATSRTPPRLPGSRHRSSLSSAKMGGPLLLLPPPPAPACGERAGWGEGWGGGGGGGGGGEGKGRGCERRNRPPVWRWFSSFGPPPPLPARPRCTHPAAAPRRLAKQRAAIHIASTAAIRVGVACLPARHCKPQPAVRWCLVGGGVGAGEMTGVGWGGVGVRYTHASQLHGGTRRGRPQRRC